MTSRTAGIFPGGNPSRRSTFGAWRHPEFENHTGAAFSRITGTVAREAIITAAAGGLGKLIEGAGVAARATEAGAIAARTATGAERGYQFEDDVRKAMGLGKATFRTSSGFRFADGYLARTGAAYEMKTGYVTLNAIVRGQIEKDAELVTSGMAKSANWIFAKGTRVSKSVYKELMNRGINYSFWAK